MSRSLNQSHGPPQHEKNHIGESKMQWNRKEEKYKSELNIENKKYHSTNLYLDVTEYIQVMLRVYA